MAPLFPGWPPPLPRKDAPAEEYAAWARQTWFWNQAHRSEQRRRSKEEECRWLFAGLVLSIIANLVLVFLLVNQAKL